MCAKSTIRSSWRWFEHFSKSIATLVLQFSFSFVYVNLIYKVNLLYKILYLYCMEIENKSMSMSMVFVVRLVSYKWNQWGIQKVDGKK